jgi:lysophospholipase L1-like esterase
LCTSFLPVVLVSAGVVVALLVGCGGHDLDEGDLPQAGQHLIVSVGDSVASGEGNPDSGPHPWADPDWCHRSHISGQAIAARELIGSHPDAGLRYVSFACSGATIDEGLLGPQRGGFLKRDEQPAQLAEQLHGLAGPIDALMISVGANDVEFAKIVGFCLFHNPCQDSTSFGPAKKWAKIHHVPPPKLSAYVTLRIDELGSEYRRVDERIPDEIPRSHVLIVEYFDPTRTLPTRALPDGACPIFNYWIIGHPENGLVSPAESRWAHDDLLIPLNLAIRSAARKNGWTLVSGVDQAFDGHGICAPKAERWIRTVKESLHLQRNKSGTLHPSEPGHQATAALIEPKLAGVLGLSP